MSLYRPFSFQLLWIDSASKVTGALSTALMNYGLVFFKFVSPVTDELTGKTIEQIQSASALNGMYLMFTIFPAVFGLLAVIPIRFNDFEGKKKETETQEEYNFDVYSITSQDVPTGPTE